MRLREALRIPLPYGIGILAILGIFAAFPQLDLQISALFYDAEARHFSLADNAVIENLSLASNFIAAGFMALCLGALGFTYVFRRHFFPRVLRLAAYFIILFALVPLLLVSNGLKEHWGRARPEVVTVFGGTQQFTPYYLPSKQCLDDCSFSSGHSVRAFYFMSLYFAAVALGVQGWRKRTLLAATLGYGLLAGSLRILEGKHFASDVMVSAMLVVYAAWVLARVMELHKARTE